MKKILSITLVVLLLSFCSIVSAQDEYAWSVAAPSGAPGVVLSTLAVENPEAYTFIAADTITAEFANENSDFVIAPLNAGAKLYKAGKSTYKLGAVVTWGNLYFASQKENFTLEDINENELTLFGENTQNASIALYALEAAGITPKSVSYLAGAANTQSLLLTDENAIVMTAEPALTAAAMKNENITAYAVNDLYKEATGYDGFAQAGLFIKAATIEEHPDAVAAFLKALYSAANLVDNDLEVVAEASVALELLPNVKVAMAAIPNCAIRYVSAMDAKEQVELTANVDLSQFGGSVPADDFYYGAE